MKFALYAVLILIILLIIGGWVARRYAESCPTSRIVYKPYIRTFIEEQEQPSYVFTLFQKMFHGNSPWVTTFAHRNFLKVSKQQPMILGERAKNELGGENTDRDDYLNTFFG